MKDPSTMKIALIGDSDVARWPVSEYPSLLVGVSGQSGATLSQINVLHDFLSTQVDVIVVCAGENDIAAGVPLWQSEQALRFLLQQLIPIASQRVFLLGPKFEPWLQDDTEMRKKYWQMHLSFQRIISTEATYSTMVEYIDSLFLFCTNATGSPVKGAVYKAVPDPKYFDDDQLHLSREGYRVWKEVLQQQIVLLAQARKEAKRIR